MIECRLIAVEGIVQGVGFRPFVYNFAFTTDSYAVSPRFF